MNEKCMYRSFKCSNIRYRDYKFCFDHILEDSSSPFTSCQYISNSTKRLCQNPVANSSKNSSISLCHTHSNLNEREPNRMNKRDLSTVYETNFSQSKWNKGNLKHDIRFKQGSAVSSENNGKWPIKKCSLWKTADLDVDVDSLEDQDNPMQYADVMTMEEAVLMSKERLVKLQSAYIDQFKQLSRVLADKRREYLENVDNDSEMDFSGRSSKKERTKLKSLLVLNNLHRHSGDGMLMHAQSKKRKADQSMSAAKQSKNRCSFVDKYTRCKRLCLPYTKYCHPHIMEDPLQILYKKCGKCDIPVCSVSNLFGDSVFCSLHKPLPQFEVEKSELDKINKLAVKQDIKSRNFNNFVAAKVDLLKEMEVETSPMELEEVAKKVDTAAKDLAETSQPSDFKVSTKANPKLNHAEPEITHVEHQITGAEPQIAQPEPENTLSTGVELKINAGDVESNQKMKSTEVEQKPVEADPGSTREEEAHFFGIGEVFAMSSVSCSDAQAIQLTPLHGNARSHLVKLRRSEEKSGSSGKSVTEIQHGGTRMTVTRAEPQNEGTKMAAGITLVPPVEEFNHNKNNNVVLAVDNPSKYDAASSTNAVSVKLESNSIVSAMIKSSDAGLARTVVKTNVLETNITGSEISNNDSAVTEIANLTLTNNKMFELDDIANSNPNTTGIEPEEDDSAPQVNDSADSDRKTSTVDEEQAVASLLSLCESS